MRHVGAATCVAFILALAACGGGREQDAELVAFPSAPLPMYSPGNSYTFDDGSVDTVIGATDDAVRWHNASGSRFVTTRDVMLPPVSWADASLRGRRSFAVPDTLFPLRAGGDETVDTVVTQQSGAGGPDMAKQERWHCQVGDAEHIRVSAGSFDTVRVDCAIKSQPGEQYAERSFFYAPSIGYYVRRIDRIGDAPPRTVELTAWTDGDPPLPDSALQQRVSAIQRALETQASGAAVGWEDSGSRVSGSVEPVSTARGDDGRWCRDFQENVGAYGRRYALNGEACRDRAGGWQVVRVYPSPAKRERAAQSAG